MARFFAGDGAVLGAARDDKRLARAQFDAAVSHLDGKTALDEKEHFVLVFMGVPVRRADSLGDLEQVAVAAREHPLGPELRQSRRFLGEAHFSMTPILAVDLRPRVLSVADLAQRAHLSVTTPHRRFRAQKRRRTGLSPSQYRSRFAYE
jgi:AraC-like DNA-binding protein